MADASANTNAYMAIIVNRLRGVGNEPKYIGWGTGTTPPVSSNTGLETPAAEARILGATTSQTTTNAGDTHQVVGTMYCSGSGKSISEVGLFDATTAGNMAIRATFDAIALAVSEGIAFTIKTVFNP